MNLNHVHSVYFSPTGNTAKAVRAVAARTGLPEASIDLTRPENRAKDYFFDSNQLLVVGAPVYGGRIPKIYEEIFERLHGDHTPAIFVVSYGNRAYEDALLELAELCEARGFVRAAAVAVTAQHSYSDKIASGQPDEASLTQLRSFGEKVGQWLKEVQGEQLPENSFAIPGNHPYREFAGMPFAPEPDESCVSCGACAKVCPVAAISFEDPSKVDAARCIDCCACVKVCPKSARAIRHPAFAGKPEKMEQAFGSPAKPNEFFAACEFGK